MIRGNCWGEDCSYECCELVMVMTVRSEMRLNIFICLRNGVVLCVVLLAFLDLGIVGIIAEFE